MTSGLITNDRRTTTPVRYIDCDGNTTTFNESVGEYYRKEWNGGDSPATANQRYTKKTFVYRVYRTNGRPYLRKRTIKVPLGGLRTAKTENSYSMSLVHNSDSTYALTEACPPGLPLKRKTNAVSTANFGQFTAMPWDSNDDLALLGKLRSKIQGEGFNLLVFLGEGKQALETITESALRITRSFYYLKRGNVFAASRALLEPATTSLAKYRRANTRRKAITEEWLASNWLQLQYGWKPLVSDIYGAAAHLATMQNRPQVLTYRVSRKKSYPQHGGGSPSPSYRLVGTNVRIGAIKAIITKINEASLVGLTNPASLLWEKLPYSFVFDWVIPIGSYLDALALDRSLTGKYVRTTFIQKVSVSAVANGAADPSFFHKNVSVTRSISSNLGVPLPSIKSWDKISSFGHCVNALALMVNGLSGAAPRVTGVRF